MRASFSVTDVVDAVLTAAVLTGIFASQIVPAAGIINVRWRASDVVCRWGGEEMLLQDGQISKAIAIANDIRAEVERTPVTFHGRAIPLTISTGVAELSEEDSEEAVVARADASLYAAKNGGRNQVVPSIGDVAAAA